MLTITAVDAVVVNTFDFVGIQVNCVAVRRYLPGLFYAEFLVFLPGCHNLGMIQPYGD